MFHLGQLPLNTVRIVLSVIKQNRHFDLSVGLDEIKFCYSLKRSEGKQILKAKVNSPSLVEALASSHKGIYKDIIEIIGVMELDTINNPVPKQFGFLGGFIFLYFP